MLGHVSMRSGMQSLLRAIYPPHCLACNGVVGTEGGLCSTCWREAPFITGLVCDLCGAPLPGDDDAEWDGGAVHCDDCLRIARPWSRGRAVFAYRGTARRLVLGFKHGDRTELARASAGWMAAVARDLIGPETLVAPVPLHWRRLLKRRYNQSALLAQALAGQAGVEDCPDLLIRPRSTGSQEGKGRDQRFDNLAGAIRVRSGAGGRIAGRAILLVDDVMTSGATFAACAEACLGAGAADVRVLALARVCKER